MIWVFLRKQETTRRDRHEQLTTRGRYHPGSAEESDSKDDTVAIDVPIEEDHVQELADV